MPKSEVERQQSVQNVLQDMQGIEPLKKLFWTELNYDRVNISLPRKGWGEHASAALVQDPALFATGGGDCFFTYIRENAGGSAGPGPGCPCGRPLHGRPAQEISRPEAP